MQKTKVSENVVSERITVNAETLASMFDCGRATAVKIGEDAHAKIKIGRRVLYNVSKIQKYLDSISEV